MSEGVPEGWDQNKIGECCEILDSRRIPLNSQERANRKGDYPYYGANGIQGYVDDFIFDGDAILVAEDGGNFDQYADRPIAQWVTGKYWVNNHAHILRAKETELDKWVFYSLVHKNIVKFINGGTRSKLNQSDLREIPILSPPLPEQKKIASILTSVDEVIETTQKQIDKLQDLKKATMNELLTKGIGHTEFKDSVLGRIPKSWDALPIIDFVIDYKGGAALKPTDFSETGFPVIPKKAIQFGGKVKLGEQRTYCDHEFAKRNPTHIVDSNYVIATLRDLVPSGPSIGLVGVLEENEYFVLAQGVYGFRLNDGLMPFFLAYLSNMDWYRKAMRKIMVGSTQVHIRNGEFLDTQIPVPSINEQKEVSLVISSFESQIKDKQNKVRKHEMIKKSLMQELLTGKVRVQVN